MLTILYPSLLAEADWRAFGAFYTPPALVGRLLDQAEEAGLNWATARVLDPAAGGSAFLVQAAVRMCAAMRGRDPRAMIAEVAARLAGLELDPRAARIAQSAVEIALAELIGAGRLPRAVEVFDALDEPPLADRDLVVGNPPCDPEPDSSPSLRPRPLRLRQSCSPISPCAGLGPAARLAISTPPSFSPGQYFSRLRSLLAAQPPSVSIDFVHARQGVFEDVLQETLLAVYRKGATPGRARICWLDGVSETQVPLVRNGDVGLPADPSGPWIAPREPSQAALVAHVETMPRLGYGVSTGPLGMEPAQEPDHLGGKDVHPLIWAEAVTTDGRFAFRAAWKNHAPWFRMEAIDDWFLVTEPWILVQRTTAEEQARRLIAAQMPAHFVARHDGVVVENHLNIVRAVSSPKAPTAVLAALLGSAVADQVFRCISGSVAVSAFELAALPLPPPAAQTRLTGLIRAHAASGTIEAEGRRLYGVGADRQYPVDLSRPTTFNPRQPEPVARGCRGLQFRH